MTNLPQPIPEQHLVVGRRTIKSLSLRQNFSWTLFGGVIYAASRWATLAVLAKIANPELVGRYALGVAVTQPIIVLALLNLRNVQATDARGEYSFGDYLRLRLFTTASALAVIAGVALLSPYELETRLVIVGIGVATAFDALADVFYGLFQQRNRMDYIAVSMALRGPLCLLGLGLGTYLTGSLLDGVIAAGVASALVFFGFDMAMGVFVLGASHSAIPPAGTEPLAQHVPAATRHRFHTLLGLIWLTLPLGATAMMLALNGNISRYFIAHFLGEHELGIFAAAASLITIGRTFLVALEDSAVPRLARHFALGERQAFSALFRKLFVFDASVGAFMLLAGLFAGRNILSILYTPDFADGIDALLWLLAAGGIGYVATLMGVGLTVARKFAVQLPLATAVTAASALTSWWLIPAYGLRGAAISAFLTAIVQLALYSLVLFCLLRGRIQR